MPWLRFRHVGIRGGTVGRHLRLRTGPQGAGGISLFVTHMLTIDGSQCRLTAEGYQTDEHIRPVDIPQASLGNVDDDLFVAEKLQSTLHEVASSW